MQNNEVVHHQPQNQSLYKHPPIEIDLGDVLDPDILEQPPTLETVPYPVTPFMLLRASGMEWLEKVRKILEELAIPVKGEFQIQQFELLAKHIYPVDKNIENTYIWLFLSRKYLAEQANLAHIFIFEDSVLDDYEKVVAAKRSIRAEIGITPFKIIFQGKTIYSDLHHVHAPDLENIQDEYSLIMALK